MAENFKFEFLAGNLALDFVNTLGNRPDPRNQVEHLATFYDFYSWAHQAGLISAEQLAHEAVPRNGSESTRYVAVQLRETLFRIFDAVIHQRAPIPEDVRSLDRHVATAMQNRRLRYEHGCWVHKIIARHNSERVLYGIAHAADSLLTAPTDLAKVRVCEAPDCRWFFLDTSKNNRRRWCDMEVCGNRTKVRQFWTRHPRSRRRIST